MATSKFGGIPVDDSAEQPKSRFGGIPVDHQFNPAAIKRPIPIATPNLQTRIAGGLLNLAELGKGAGKQLAEDAYETLRFAGPGGMLLHAAGDLTGTSKKIEEATKRTTPMEKAGGYAMTGAEMLMPTPGGKPLKAAEKVAQDIYEAQLKIPKKVSLAQRQEMVVRGLKDLPVSENSIATLDKEIAQHKEVVNQLTKDPASPYSQSTISIPEILKPVNLWIKRVARVDERAANALKRARDTWAKSLGFEAPTADKEVATGILDAEGKPITRTEPGKPGVIDTTVAKAQQLKEDLYAIINSNAYGEGAKPGTFTAGEKLAARGMKRAIENSAPGLPIKAINHVIENDIRLKDAINSAVKANPSWLKDNMAWIMLSTGGTEAIGALATGHVELAAAGVGGMIAGLAKAASRNPKVMSRLAIALNKSGIPYKAAALGAVKTSEAVPSSGNVPTNTPE
jgi:hypothetical protein